MCVCEREREVEGPCVCVLVGVTAFPATFLPVGRVLSFGGKFREFSSL